MTIDGQTDPRLQVIQGTGHILVIGGAGSGKTTVALRKAVKRISDGLFPGQKVLFLSFSNAAVSRISQAARLEVPVKQRACLALQTLHSFCWDILRTHGYLLGAPRRLKLLAPQDERALSNGAERGSAEWGMWEVERRRLFRDEGRVGFDLFAPLASEILERCALIRELFAARFPLIVLDEAQDTGPGAWKCIELLAPLVQVLCLADMEQQIFDHLEGVGPERINQIIKCLNPDRIDLGGENHRSPGTEILAFANDVLNRRVRSTAYAGVTYFKYDPRNVDFPKLVRIGLAQVFRAIKKGIGRDLENCAILAPSSFGVAKISAALQNGSKSIVHKVLFDEASTLLAGRLAAFLLEPKSEDAISINVAVSLELLSDIRRAAGTKGGREESARLLLWAGKLRAGKLPRNSVVGAATEMVRAANRLAFTGNPSADWLAVKKLLQTIDHDSISSLAHHLDYFVAFRRGKKISANLSNAWARSGSYEAARQALDSALAEDQILSGVDDLSGIHVMTIHRSKGKQFDGVIILREGRRTKGGWNSSFVWRDDQPPFSRSRRILRVGITRAIHHVLILDPAFPACPILRPSRT